MNRLMFFGFINTLVPKINSGIIYQIFASKNLNETIGELLVIDVTNIQKR